MQLAKARVGYAHVEETAAAVVQAHAAAGTKGSGQQPVFDRSEPCGEVMQQQQLVIALAAELAQQRQQLQPGAHRQEACRRVEAMLVGHIDVVDAVQAI